jgi:hypothetical protein
VESDDSWTVNSIFYQPFSTSGAPTASTSRWIIRRQFGRAAELSTRVEWADSATCPRLLEVLGALTEIPVPAVQVPGVTPQRPYDPDHPVSISSHPTVFTIWSGGASLAGAPAWIRLSGLGGELNSWGIWAEGVLAPCWTQETPRAA